MPLWIWFKYQPTQINSGYVTDNLSIMPLKFMNHDHEEADTLLRLHALVVAKDHPFKEWIILSSNTDVFTLLIYYQSFPHSTYFQTGTGESQHNIDIHSCYGAISVKHAQAILGFHVLTSCDQISRFSGKTKLSWWK